MLIDPAYGSHRTIDFLPCRPRRRSPHTSFPCRGTSRRSPASAAPTGKSPDEQAPCHPHVRRRTSDLDSRTAKGNRRPAPGASVTLLGLLADRSSRISIARSIPKRRVRIRDPGAYSTLTVTHDISRYTRTKLFSGIGKEDRPVPALSAVAKRARVRQTRNATMRVRFYTEETLGSRRRPRGCSYPRSAGYGRPQKRDAPRTCNPVAVWDFWSRHPESLHQV